MSAPRSVRRGARGRPGLAFPAALGAVAAILVLALLPPPASRAEEGPVAQDPGEPSAAEEGLSLLTAMELTLRHDPAIALVASQLAGAHGARVTASGGFDPVLTAGLTQSDDRTPVDPATSQTSSSLSGSLELTVPWRSGLSLTPSVELDRSDGQGAPLNEATVTFTLRQPLLRDRGRAVVAADEDAARHEEEAARRDLEHAITERLLTVATRYWDVRSAILDLEVLKATEARSREHLESTRRLIAADLTPAAEIVQLEADLASREAARIAGEHALFQARQELGREIGLEPAAIAALPLAVDPFPELAPEALPEDAGAWIAEALERRADLAADRERLAAAEIREHAAENALRPRLDLVLTPSYSGLAEGGGAGRFFAPLLDHVPGLSTSFGLSLSWPTWNRRAQGQRIQATAARRQSELAAELTARAIGAAVPIALDAARQSARQLRKINEAEEYFVAALDNELKKLRAGASTLVDVITQRDRLTAIQRQRVGAQLAVALALLDVRFQTATLVEADPTVADPTAATVSVDHLTTLPP